MKISHLTASHVNLLPNGAELTTTLLALPTEILVKIFKSTSLAALASLTQSCSLFRTIVKEHARDICNALVEKQLVRSNAEDLFDLNQNESAEGWLLPNESFFRGFEARIPYIEQRYRGSHNVSRRSLKPLMLPGPKFLHFIETQASHMRYFASRRRQNLAELRKIRREKFDVLRLRMSREMREYENLTDEEVERFIEEKGAMMMSVDENDILERSCLEAVDGGERWAMQYLLVPAVRKYGSRVGDKQLVWWYGL